MRALKLLLLFCFTTTVLFAGEFGVANRHYEEGGYAEAKQVYERLVQSGTLSANLFYNLGNTEYKLGNKGRALLNYERALALEPSHPEAKANLQLLREETGAQLGERNLLQRLFSALGINVYVAMGAVAFWSALLGIMLNYTTSSRTWWPVVFSLALASFGLTGAWVCSQERALAVITASVGEARFAPAENSVLVGKLPTGSRVHLLADRGAWSYVALPDGKRAWMASGALEKIHP